MRRESFRLETKQSRMKMALCMLADNDTSVWQVDAGIRNKFKWCCLDESMTLPGGKIVKFSECFKEISLSGKVLCVFCNDTTIIVVFRRESDMIMHCFYPSRRIV